MFAWVRNGVAIHVDVKITHQARRLIANHQFPMRTRRKVIGATQLRLPILGICATVLELDGAQDRGEVARAARGVRVANVGYGGAELFGFGCNEAN